MKHVFGPVPSRRLGRSLGVDVVPFKRCTYDCVYCQLGRTTRADAVREDRIPPGEILQEIRAALERGADEADCVCFTGRGEPTLCRSLGLLVRRAKAMTARPVAVLTNGSLLWREDVRRELQAADLVLPSLDAADADTFARINRPFGMPPIGTIIDGLVRFRESYRGRLWVEIMLVGGVNDREEPLLALREALARIRPDRVHFNTPVRPPSEGWVRPPDAAGMVRAHAIIQPAVLLTAEESGDLGASGEASAAAGLLAIVSRHPVREDRLAQRMGRWKPAEIDEAVRALEDEGRVRRIRFRGEAYLAAAQGHSRHAAKARA